MALLYKIRPAAADDAEAIRAIRNDVIQHSTAMWTTTLLTPEDGETWLAENLARRSVFVAEAAGDVVGFANWAPWRPKDGYRHTVEDSVYLVAGHQGRGIGAELLRTLIAGASDSGAHVMMACIEATNAPASDEASEGCRDHSGCHRDGSRIRAGGAEPRRARVHRRSR
jgi:L-amino acid N-acyltransferase